MTSPHGVAADGAPADMAEDALPPGLASDLDVLVFAEAELAAGRPAALVTIVGLDGPFSRPLGAQLAVAGDRQHHRREAPAQSRQAQHAHDD